MKEDNNLKSIELIKTLIAENETSEALSVLLEISEPNKKINDVIRVINAEFTDLMSERILGTIDDNKARAKMNDINKRLLMSLEMFDKKGVVLPDVNIETGKTTKFLLRLSLYLLGIAIFILLVDGIMNFFSEYNNQLADDIIVFSALPFSLGGITLLGWFLAILVRAFREK